MKKVLKTIGWLLLIALIAIQFFHPKKNIHEGVQPNAISKKFQVSADVKIILDKACMDCHSNNTRYPWYANLQPVGWLLAKHIKDGKVALNFSEFSNYSERRQLSKLKAIRNSVKDGSMPITAYTLMHRYAKLSTQNRALFLQWTLKIIDSLSSQTKRK